MKSAKGSTNSSTRSQREHLPECTTLETRHKDLDIIVVAELLDDSIPVRRARVASVVEKLPLLGIAHAADDAHHQAPLRVDDDLILGPRGEDLENDRLETRCLCAGGNGKVGRIAGLEPAVPRVTGGFEIEEVRSVFGAGGLSFRTLLRWRRVGAHGRNKWTVFGEGLLALKTSPGLCQLVSQRSHILSPTHLILCMLQHVVHSGGPRHEKNFQALQAKDVSTRRHLRIRGNLVAATADVSPRSCFTIDLGKFPVHVEPSTEVTAPELVRRGRLCSDLPLGLFDPEPALFVDGVVAVLTMPVELSGQFVQILKSPGRSDHRLHEVWMRRALTQY